MKHYLKQVSNYGLTLYTFYDVENQVSIRLDRFGVEFENAEDIEWHISHDLSNGYKFITREEFGTYFTERVNKLNELSKLI